uniref:Uncharacterized protein n=1 Tax=Spongospora subterranea TaxID=70186 RepID=A0A0H5QNK7_9EUKA|eukprot:CRZ03162.1 hypothetical protein [Spongospora subterranea]
MAPRQPANGIRETGALVDPGLGEFQGQLHQYLNRIGAPSRAHCDVTDQIRWTSPSSSLELRTDGFMNNGREMVERDDAFRYESDLRQKEGEERTFLERMVSDVDLDQVCDCSEANEPEYQTDDSETDEEEAEEEEYGQIWDEDDDMISDDDDGLF